MTKSLILALSADPGGPIAWGLGALGPDALGDGDSAGSALAGRLEATGRIAGPEAFDDLPLDQANRVIAIVPGGDVLARDVTIQARREAELRTAVPYLLEDDLARDPNTLHFAFGPAGEAGTRRVAAADRDAIARWRDVLAPLQSKPITVIADYDALSPPADGYRIVDRGDRVVVVPAEGAGFTADAAIAPMMVAELAEDGTPLALETDNLQRLVPATLTARYAAAARPAMTDGAFFSEALSQGPARWVDLMAGAFTRPEGGWLSLALWRRAAVLAGLVVLAYGLSVVGQGWRYDRLADDLNTRAVETFQATFPEVRRVVNPRTQMSAKLAELKSAASDRYLRLSGLLFAGVSDIPAIEIRDVRFIAERDELSASIAYADYRDMERLKAAVTGLGGRLEEGGSRQDDNAILGDITIGLR